jgi:predicted peroxiredoxin
VDQWPDSRRRLAILLWATDPSVPDACATPFFHAAAAAAMDIAVEMYFVSRAVRLLVPGVAASLLTEPGGTETVYGFMQRAAALGVKFYACPQAMKAQGVAFDHLIPECSGAAGATAFVARALDPSWATLTY